ncbi:regucalcin [Microplitis demolitor]|uniref:regucalcin n=1 Tax=Microplitis demolitor TaxID=69319 RepID=UPI00235B65A3|nr:regucalcin [Microplitis demolitor]
MAGKKNTLIAGCGTYLVSVSWDPSADDPDPKIDYITKIDIGVRDSRFNDGKVDPQGRLWAGTMGEKNGVPLQGRGSLYRFEHDGTATKMISSVDISNGLVWSHTNDSFYYIDSFAYKIVVYRYNDYTGDIANKCSLFDFKENKISGIPDGMTIDKAGNLWVANHSGGLVLQIDSKTGALLQSIKIPVSLVTSVAFGGPNKDILYITSARDKLSETQLQKEPLAGSVFALYGLGITGSSMLPLRTSSKQIKIEAIGGPYSLSEGPHWDEERNLLYYVDIPEQKIYCWNPTTKKITHAYLKNGPVGVAVPVVGENNTFIVGCGTSLVRVTWDPSTDNTDPEVKTLATVDSSRDDIRINDGKVDPRGRFWAGTMGEKNNVITPEKGSLYRFSFDATPTKLISPVSISNGLAWSHSKDSFYYIDSPTLEVVAFDYNDDSGDISNKRTVFNLKDNKITGFPDGMTIDKAGNLWVAVYDGGKVLQIDPRTGRLLQTISMPATKITSVAFGGPNKDILYVTSAKNGLTDAELKDQPLAGSVFAVHGLGIAGNTMLAAKIK